MDPVIAELQDMVQELYRTLADLREETNNRLAHIVEELGHLAARENPGIAACERAIGDLEAKIGSRVDALAWDLGPRVVDLEQETTRRLASIEERLAKMATPEGVETVRLTRLADIERRLDRLEERTGFLQ